MFSPLISWILPFSSSSSSSSDSVDEEDEEEEEEQSLDTYDDELDHENDNVAEDQKDDHFLSSCNVDDDDDSIPVALAIPNPSPAAVTVAFPTVEEGNAVTTATTIVSRRPKRKSIERITDYSVVGKQNQRLWTKQDEMELLKGYLDYMKNERGGTTTTLQNDVALLYDHVRPKLKVDFNKNQLVEKLRRLKRKHKVCMDKVKLLASGPPTFKNLQDKAIFEISHKIWGNDKDQFGNLDDHGIGNGNIAVKNEQVENDCDDVDNRAPKRLRTCNDDHDHNNGDNGIRIQGLIEETMRSCFSPLLKQVLDDPQGGSEEAKATPPPLCCGELKDRKILELEVYLNRLELLQGQIKDRLEELRSG
ncbi:hypothetical protein RIF29_21959 [Crotalaria pallida]|uniref:Glabrous enhancer-binding protein-like DBD domain-containing protein n=1 Tax=Crotalaria pallida TaxID=3830 RepID=A0AAN9F5R5_CROPI